MNNTEISKNKTPINWDVLHGNKTSCLNVLWSIPPAPYSSVHDNFIGLLNEMFKLNLKNLKNKECGFLFWKHIFKRYSWFLPEKKEEIRNSGITDDSVQQQILFSLWWKNGATAFNQHCSSTNTEGKHSKKYSECNLSTFWNLPPNATVMCSENKLSILKILWFYKPALITVST